MTEVNHEIYRVQYFDITEYIIGKRVGKSPLKAMLYLEERKLAIKSTQTVFQEDPMRCWFRAMLYANIPFLVLWFLARLFLFGSMVVMDVYYVLAEICLQSSINGSAACFERSTFEMYMYEVFYFPSSAFVVVLISVVDDMIGVVCYMCCRPRWLRRTVYGKKVTCVRYRFYVLIHSFCVIIYAVDHFISIVPVFMLAFGFVWSFLFFLQILPMFGNYAVATQRMISVFVEFSLVFSIFYLSYCFTLYKLLFPFYGADFANIRLAAYNTFLIMQNMFAYTYVNENRDILMTIQRLSVAMAAEERFTMCLAPLRNCLRRKYLVYEGGRVYIPRTISSSRLISQQSQNDTSRYH